MSSCSQPPDPHSSDLETGQAVAYASARWLAFEEMFAPEGATLEDRIALFAVMTMKE